MNASPHALRPMRFGGERRYALALGSDATVESAREACARAKAEGAVLGYGFLPAREAEAIFGALGWESLGPAPLLVRPLRFAKVPLVAPFGRRRRTGFREIAVKEPRISRLWDRFSIDIGVGIERTASTFDRRVFDRLDQGYRVFIVEDGDRYAIRAMCIFDGVRGHVLELLHDRSVTGLRAASHLLGLAVREMLDAGAETATAWSLPHSGSYPIFARHAFFASRTIDLRFGAGAFDPDLEDVVTARDRWYVSYLDLDTV
ncbi:MAG: hypothetical protein JWP87_449 [Labilithrix sp.]|nr:hypothetical protein [Labilithrix sp.]